MAGSPSRALPNGWMDGWKEEARKKQKETKTEKEIQHIFKAMICAKNGYQVQR